MLRLLSILKTTRAAIDLASIMVGIIVIGIIGGVIAATVFAVIPWAQDNSAKQQLGSAATAESAYAGLNDGHYTASLGSLFNSKSANVTVRSDESSCYLAFVQSASGKNYYISSTSQIPTQVASPWPSTAPANAPANCAWPTSSADAISTDILNLVPNSIPAASYPYGYESGEGNANVTFATTGGPQNDGYQRLTFTSSAATQNASIVLSPRLYSTPLKNNTTYTFTEMVRPSVTVTQATATIFFSSDNSYNSSISAGTLPANKWTQVKYTFTTNSSNITGLWPQFRLSGTETGNFTAGTTLDATEAMLSSGVTTRAFANGDTPGWSWLGQPGDSVSSGRPLS